MKRTRKHTTHKLSTKLELSLGDAIDRVSILIRKIYFGEEGAMKEFIYLTEGIDKLNLKLSGALLSAIIRIAMMNFEVWIRENAFRKGEDLPAEQVKKMMIEVRDCNSKRIENKNEINRLTEMGFREFKIQHRSR
jgi:hypothetical protein